MIEHRNAMKPWQKLDLTMASRERIEGRSGYLNECGKEYYCPYIQTNAKALYSNRDPETDAIG